jgi:flavorubredoxin
MVKNTDNQILTVKPGVHWIGVLDYDIVTFDVVMETEYGTTYNAYFIEAEKKALIENVKEGFWDVYEAKLRSLTDPAAIDYIIMNHTEPDHSGTLGKLLDIAPKAVVVGTGNAIRYLKDLIGPDFPHMIVKEGDTIDLGGKTLKFIAAPNLHWPDTMYTWLPEDGIIFSCDSFGAHYCDDRMFDDAVGDFDDAFKYYFDVIMKPFSKFMLKAIEKIRELPVQVICTGHGPILRSNWKKYLDLTESMAAGGLSIPGKPRVFIPYVSAYHKTGMIAEAIEAGVREAGDIETDICDIEKLSIGEMDERMAQATGVIVGSPTINQNILLPVYKLFSVISPLRDRNKLAGGFGSYGWSGEGSRIIRSGLENLRLEYFEDGAFYRFTPGKNELEQCRQYGLAYGKRLLKKSLGE